MTEVWPPAVVNTARATGTGQIPDKEDQMYVVTRDELYLVPTAEVPVTNLHRDEILEAAELPIRYAAYSPCFRREAGAAGKDTRGILRVHQFDKVEMVLFEKPDDSPAALEWMTERAEILLQRLGPRIPRPADGTREMGFVQAKKYDLEVWAPGVERWLEVSSCSNFRDYQARRMAIRYRPEPGAKPELVHTLNGSGLALARVVAAILETYQRPDGSVEVPDVLRPVPRPRPDRVDRDDDMIRSSRIFACWLLVGVLAGACSTAGSATFSTPASTPPASSAAETPAGSTAPPPTAKPTASPAAQASAATGWILYDPGLDVPAAIGAALAQAKVDEKKVLLDFGADWCPDCHVLDSDFKDPRAEAILEDSYHVVHIDVGYFDKNLESAAKYGNVIAVGIPSVVILDAKGTKLVDTAAGELADSRRYTADDIVSFLSQWATDAADRR